MPRTRAQQYPRTRADLRGEPIIGMHDELDPNIAKPNYAVVWQVRNVRDAGERQQVVLAH